MTGPQMRWKPHRSSFRVTFIHIVAAEILLGTFLGVVLYLDVEFPPLEHFVGVNVEEDNDKFLHLAVNYVLVHSFFEESQFVHLLPVSSRANPSPGQGYRI